MNERGAFMKKNIIFLFCLSFFVLIPNVAAANKCSSADSSRWEYEKSLTSKSDISKEGNAKKVVCCTPDDTDVWWCDHYTSKVSANELNKCPFVDSDQWQFSQSTTANSNITHEDENEKVVCCTPDDTDIWWCDHYRTTIDSSAGNGVTVSGAYCSNPNFVKPFKLLGRVFSVVKIIIPIIIIVFGVIDFFKAVIGSKDDEIKKSVKSLIMRLIAGACIFFLPAIVHFVFRLVDDWNDYESDYSKCSLCITEPNKC